MVKSGFPVKDVFEVIYAAKNTVENNIAIGCKITELYVKKFGGERSIFFIPDGNSKYKELIKKNMDEGYNKKYKEYYYKFDPLNLLKENTNEEIPYTLVETIDYSGWQKGEYYNDFLAPQKIYYKLLVYLKTDKGLLAKILLTKSKNSGNFSEQDISIAKEITPYIAHALEYNRLKREISENNGLLELIEDNLTTGIILLGPSKKIIHMNLKAIELCNLVGTKLLETRNIRDIHPFFVKDCLEMVDEYNENKSNRMILPRKRIFHDNPCNFTIYSKFISDQDGSNYFLINISENSVSTTLNKEELRDVYHLSCREIDVSSQTIKGLHNSEIAQNLFISEVTVKKHLQHIFSKMGVSNRASLVQKVLLNHHI